MILKGARELGFQPIQLCFSLIRKVLANKCGPTITKHGKIRPTNPAQQAHKHPGLVLVSTWVIVFEFEVFRNNFILSAK
jgi:hypothetical protein